MSDEVASLKVLLTADGAEMQSVIQQTTAELTGMSAAVGTVEKLSNSSQKALDKITTSTKTYGDAVKETKAALDEKRAALANSSSEYKQNAKNLVSSTKELKSQKTALEKSVRAKNNEISALERANQSINKGSKAYKENKKAIEWAKNEQRDLEERYNSCSAQIQEQTNKLTTMRKERSKERQALRESSAAYDEMAGRLEAVEKLEKAYNLQEQGAKLKDLGSNIDTVTKPLQVGAVALAAGGVAAAKFAMEYETAFTGVKKTVDGTDEQLNQLSQDIRQMAVEIPVSAEELANLAAIGGQLGVPIEQIGKFTKTIAAMGVATNLSGEEGASALARIVNVTGESMDNVDRIGSAIVALGNNSATTEAEIAEMAQRMGKFGNTVGINSHQVLAYSAALASMGVEAQAGGNAIGRVWMDIESAVTEGGSALDAYARYAGKSADEFKKQWSADASGAFSGLIKGLSEAENLTAAIGEIGVENTIDVQSVMALANGYDKLTASLELSSEAYAENNALTKEADAAYATTANQIQIAKNNLVEAGISFGEVLLPSVVNATDGIKGFAQGLANLDEGTKENIVNIGKWVIGLGAASKVSVGAIKGVGGAMEAYGKIKEAMASGGTLAKLAPALTKIGAAAPYAALGIAAVGTAVWVGKKSYEVWYDSQYRWTKGLSEGNEQIQESMDSLKELDSIQKDLKNAQLVIENPESSQEEVANAKSKIEEIKELLEKEYDLKIRSDNSNLDSTIERLKTINKNEVKTRIASQTNEMADLRSDFEEYQRSYDELYQKQTDAVNEQVRLSEAIQEVKMASDEEREAILAKYGYNTLANLEADYADAFNAAEKLSDDLENLEGSYNEYRSIATEIANWQSELLGMDALEGDAKGVADALSGMGEMIRFAELDLHGYAIAAAEAMNGQGSLKKAWEEGGETLNNVVNDYIRASTEFGASTQSTAVGAALLSEKFKSIEEAAGTDGGIERVTQKANELAKTMEGFPENTSIQIEANGDISLIDDVSGKIKEIQTTEGLTVRVDAEGNVETLDKAGNQISYLENVGAVSVRVNAETGNLEALNEAGDIVATIESDPNKNIGINVTANTDTAKATIAGLNNEKVEVPVDANTSQAERTILGLNGTTVTINVKGNPLGLASGTQDAPGGLAMINDQKGIPDPRELVEVDGKGYIFEGKDVVLPLPKHAKVYTASQTKRMMAGLGIPHYASGKDNDPWENDKSDWTHYTKASLVPISASEYLDWIEKMRQKYAGNIEAMKELDEMWVDATKDSWDEWTDNLEYALNMGEISEKEYYGELQTYLDEYVTEGTKKYKDMMLELRKGAIDALDTANEASEAWLGVRLGLNDWDELGDSAEAAFRRIRDRNMEAAEAGLISWEEYFDTVNDSFKDILTGRDTYSANWIQAQKDYYGMSASEEYAAHQRRMDNLNEFIASCGELTDEQWAVVVELQAEIEQDSWDAAARKVEQWRDDASFYKQQSEVFGWDWLNQNDSALKYWERVLKEESRYAEDLELSINDRQAAARKADEARLEIYQAKTDELDEAMQKYQDEIDAMREQLDDKVQELRDSWTVEDRQKDMAELEEQLKIYKGAVTLEGRDKYESLLDEYEQLEREEQIYQLESENDEIIAAMEEEYARMEAEGKEILQSLRDELTAGYKSQSQEISAVNAVVESATKIGNDIAEQTRGFVESLETEQVPALQNALNNIADIVAKIQEAQKELDINYVQTNYFTVADNVDASSVASKITRQFQSQYGGR